MLIKLFSSLIYFNLIKKTLCHVHEAVPITHSKLNRMQNTGRNYV